jgi:hypothetical protein
MPGDSSGCRLHAASCLRQARRAKNPETVENLTAMAEAWTRLAAEMEADQKLLQTIYEMKFPEPYETVPFLLNLRLGSR